MTRIALILTAIPLAVALATLLNTLLDRRLAAVTRSVRRSPSSKPLALFALLTTLAVAPAMAAETSETPEPGCAAIECSLTADATRVNDLWHREPRGIVLVSQSEVPVSVETTGGIEELDTRQLTVERERAPRPRQLRDRSAPTTR